MTIRPAVSLQIVETSDSNEPLTFEVGAGEVFGNKMFQVESALQPRFIQAAYGVPQSVDLMYQQAFDAGVRGLHIGEKTYLEVQTLCAAFSTAYVALP